MEQPPKTAPASAPSFGGKTGRFARSLRRVAGGLAVAAVVLALCAAYAHWVEPEWVRVKTIALSPSPTVRVVHITDIHFKGDRRYLEGVVKRINALDADCVCFTGDLIEEARFLPEALEILGTVHKPLYGVIGNHDQWALRSFADMCRAFRATGGDLVREKAVVAASGKIEFLSASARDTPSGVPNRKRILLEHYPTVVDQLGSRHFDAILSGHTHGGQIRLPFLLGEIRKYFGPYDRGLFQTPSGPLYVNPGIGTFFLKARFLCRPEITLIAL